VSRLLVASHIKPWADCTTDAERLDVFNGLLLAPNLAGWGHAGVLEALGEQLGPSVDLLGRRCP